MTLKRRGGPRLRTIGSISVVRLLDRLRLEVSPGVLGADWCEPTFAGYQRPIMELVGCTVPDGRLRAPENRQAPR